jgi:hypothetical protein
MTYLYPLTKNQAVLEILAAVTAGTAQAWATFEAPFRRRGMQLAKFGSGSPGTKSTELKAHVETYRAALAEHPELEKFDRFMATGWGATNAGTDVILDELEENGNTDWELPPIESDLIGRILQSQNIVLPDNITLEELEGLRWG